MKGMIFHSKLNRSIFADTQKDFKIFPPLTSYISGISQRGLGVRQ